VQPWPWGRPDEASADGAGRGILLSASPLGGTASALTATLRGWRYVVHSGGEGAGRRSALLFVDHLGNAVGRLQSSIRYRYLFPLI